MSEQPHPRHVAAPAEAVLDEVERAVVGKRDVLELVLLALLADGHVLLEDVPGVAKTLIARSFASATGLRFGRVQFTPDLLPSDVTGSSVFDQRAASFEFRPGPVFCNLLLGDEINRAPPKTQAALLEAMEERQVTADDGTHQLEPPFLVLATQNPIEYEGTYPLPEAQLDRFLLKVVLPVPERAEELEIVRRHATGFDPHDVAGSGVTAVAGSDDVEAGRRAASRVQLSPEVAGYVVDVARATRQAPSLGLGASPRGAVSLMRTARAWAWLSGREFVTPDDVKALAQATLAHRLSLRPEAELEGVDVSAVLASALGSVAVPR
jgi:MoxR-like ATPase